MAYKSIRDLLRKRSMTVAIDNGTVRVVVFQKNEAIAWGTSQTVEEPETDQVETNRVTCDRSIATHPIMTDSRYRHLKLITELPLFAPLIRSFKLPRIAKGFFKQVLISEIVDTLPFELEGVDIVWQTRQGVGDLDIFAIAVPKDVVDEHVKVVNQAGFNPSVTFSRGVALAAAAGVSDAIIVHISEGEAGLVLVRDRRPKLIHQYPVTVENLTPTERGEALVEAVEKIAGHEQSMEHNEDSPDLPVVITGPVDAYASLIEAFTRLTERDLLKFSPEVVCPDGFPASEYAVNIGLAVANRTKEKHGRRMRPNTSPAFTLLSERHLPRTIPFRPIAIFMTLMLFGVVAFNATPQVDEKVIEASNLSQRINSLERQARNRRINLSVVRELEEQIALTSNQTDLLKLRLDTLEVELDAMLSQLEAITGDLVPDGVGISSIQLGGTEYILSGTAQSYENVIEYTTNLRNVEDDLFTEVRILRVASTAAAEILSGFEQPDAGIKVGFQVKAVINSSAIFVDPKEDIEENQSGRVRRPLPQQ